MWLIDKSLRKKKSRKRWRRRAQLPLWVASFCAHTISVLMLYIKPKKRKTEKRLKGCTFPHQNYDIKRQNIKNDSSNAQYDSVYLLLWTGVSLNLWFDLTDDKKKISNAGLLHTTSMSDHLLNVISYDSASGNLTNCHIKILKQNISRRKLFWVLDARRQTVAESSCGKSTLCDRYKLY